MRWVVVVACAINVALSVEQRNWDAFLGWLCATLFSLRSAVSE